MPPGGAEARAEQRATLNRIAHELQIAPELGELLESLRDVEDAHDHDSFEASLIRVARRDYEKQARVPAELRAEMTRAGSRGYRAWLEAREAKRLRGSSCRISSGASSSRASTSPASSPRATRTTCSSTTTSPG